MKIEQDFSGIVSLHSSPTEQSYPNIPREHSNSAQDHSADQFQFALSPIDKKTRDSSKVSITRQFGLKNN